MRLQDILAFHSSSSENSKALDQLRYTIIGSQLLNDRRTIGGYSPRSSTQESSGKDARRDDDDASVYTSAGLGTTAGAAFALVWSIHWARGSVLGQASWWPLTLVFSILMVLIAVSCILLRRQYLRYTRLQAIEAASSMVANAQAFDAAASAASTLIQEVELVSKGYRISSPLPPASRLDDQQTQTRRCARLRRALRSSLKSLVLLHVAACKALNGMTIDLDLERYHDMYELSRSDMEEVEETMNDDEESVSDAESLRCLKISLHKLHIARKLFLCSLLALDTNRKHHSSIWSQATEIMQNLSSEAATAATALDNILCEEERFKMPATPNYKSKPGKERLQAQIRRFATLSQGLRGLQARMHVLREESDKTLDSSHEVTELGSSLLEHYDAIGADLKMLMQEWQDGRVALTANIGKNERRISLSSTELLLSRSTSPSSLGGTTVVGDSPSEALQILNGDSMLSLSVPSSDEEMYEAVAIPRPKSNLSREGRIAKMKEDRIRQASAREKADASRHMVKELETVIKMRPRGKSAGKLLLI